MAYGDEGWAAGQTLLGFWFGLMNAACAMYPDEKPAPKPKPEEDSEE